MHFDKHSDSTWSDQSEPEVLWGENGIDALLWGDPVPPYAVAELLGDTAVKPPAEQMP